MTEPDALGPLNANRLIATFIRIFIFIMSLFGLTLHLQSKPRTTRAVKRRIEHDTPFDNSVKRVSCLDSDESNEGSTSDEYELRTFKGLCGAHMEISGIIPLDATTKVTSVESDDCSLDNEMDEFLDSVALEPVESMASVYYDAECEIARPDTVLQDAIGENVFWSIGHEVHKDRLCVHYKCHICSAILNTDKKLLEHFVLEHEMDLIVM